MTMYIVILACLLINGELQRVVTCIYTIVYNSRLISYHLSHT